MRVVGWEFMHLEGANLISWTDDRERVEDWLAQAKAGKLGDVDDIGVASVDERGYVVEVLWPEYPS